jgi:hypothetical protein
VEQIQLRHTHTTPQSQAVLVVVLVLDHLGFLGSFSKTLRLRGLARRGEPQFRFVGGITDAKLFVRLDPAGGDESDGGGTGLADEVDIGVGRVVEQRGWEGSARGEMERVRRGWKPQSVAEKDKEHAVGGAAE